MDRLPPMDLLIAFEAAARHLSFTRAAAERFVTQSAMSRQMRSLEESLGVALFERRHRALALTPHGLALQAACEGAFDPLRRAIAQIRAPAVRETLSLTTTPGLASLWLIPRLSRFTRQHPGVDVRLDASFEPRRLRAEGFDVAIRYGPVDTTPGTPLFAESMQIVCSPRLLRGKGPPLRRPADLRFHTLLQVSHGVPSGGMPLGWEPWLQAVGLPELQPAGALSFSGYNEAIAAAVAGQGVAIGKRPLVDGLLRERKLAVPFQDAASTSRGYFLIIEPSAGVRAPVQALQAWLLAEARSTAAEGGGSAAPGTRASAQAGASSPRRKVPTT